MFQEKYTKFTFIEKKTFQYYMEIKENNYSEIIITDFVNNKENKLIKDFITEFKNLVHVEFTS